MYVGQPPGMTYYPQYSGQTMYPESYMVSPEMYQRQYIQPQMNMYNQYPYPSNFIGESEVSNPNYGCKSQLIDFFIDRGVVGGNTRKKKQNNQKSYTVPSQYQAASTPTQMTYTQQAFIPSQIVLFL